MDRRKLEEEQAAAEAIDVPEDGEKANLSNSASAYLQTQDKETNAQSSSSDDTKERMLASGTTKRKPKEPELDKIQSDKKLTNEKPEFYPIRKSPYLVKTTFYKNHPEILFFLEQMNKFAEDLGLKCSQYDSPHGLANYNNKSTALDVAKLSTAAM